MAQRLRVHAFSVSIDGYGAGPNQGLEAPLGERGLELHEWVYPTRTFTRMVGGASEPEAGSVGLDDDFVAAGFDGIGATIMGRNMFGPIRGDWPDHAWTGWWGDDPPYHHPVFILTHHPRPSVAMRGGTTFHFVDEPIADVLARAFDAAGGLDVRLGGGVSAIRQYAEAGLLDYLHLALVPVVLGDGERLLDLPALRDAYDCRLTPSATVTHAELTRGAS